MNPSDPAFPAEWVDIASGSSHMQFAKGMTKREYFAAEAMKALIVKFGVDAGRQIALYAAMQADDLIAELSK